MAYDRHIALMRLIGLGSVDQRENPKALIWARRLEWPLSIAVIWILIDWYLQASGTQYGFVTNLTDWLIWLLFIAETTILTSLVDDKRRYLQQNWLNLVIILAGLPIIWGVDTFYAGTLRTLRLLLMFGILFRVSKDIRILLARHNLGLTLLVCFFIMIISGILIAGIDPAFKTPLDGVWWAWVTVTTVGYGDLVPSTTEGRVFGAILILMGIALFSMLTASFSVFFISQDEKELTDKERHNLNRIELLENRLERIEDQLDQTLHCLKEIQRNKDPDQRQ